MSIAVYWDDEKNELTMTPPPPKPPTAEEIAELNAALAQWGFVVVSFEDIDRYQMNAILAIDEHCTTNPGEFAADIESWLTPMVERFYQDNPSYVSPLDRPFIAESEATDE